MPTYFMGIDNGGTMTKAAIFDSRGKEIAVATGQTPTITPQEGYYERDMLVLWEATKSAIATALKKSGIAAADIKAIGCTGHGKGLYLWGKDGKPAYHAVASTDHRASEYVARWLQDGTGEKAKEKTLQNVIECQPVAILAWLRDNHPEVLDNTRWIFEAKDYIRFMLTGQAFAEITDYSGTSLMNLKSQTFDQELLKLFGLGDLFDRLPPLKNSYDNCGYVTQQVAEETGLCAGTPVCGGMFDIDACAIAMDVSSEEPLCVITGTWSINEYISKTPVRPDTTTQNSLFCVPGYYLIEESSPTSAGNLEWVVKQFFEKENLDAKAKGETVYKEVDRLVEQTLPQASEIIFLPFLYGSNVNYQSGAFLGLNHATTKAQLARAVFEGVVFSHKMHIDRLLKHRKAPKTIRIAGGVVHSSVWLQIFADVTGIPLEVVAVKEMGTLGCAMAAAVSVGEYKNYADAAKHMVNIVRKIMPDANNSHIYAGKYRRYQAVIQALQGLSI